MHVLFQFVTVSVCRVFFIVLYGFDTAIQNLLDHLLGCGCFYSVKCSSSSFC